MVERPKLGHAIHFTIENENAIASKLGGPPAPPASTFPPPQKKFWHMYTLRVAPLRKKDGTNELSRCVSRRREQVREMMREQVRELAS